MPQQMPPEQAPGAVDPAMAQQAPGAVDPAMGQEAAMGEEAPPEADPAFVEAMNFARTALYKDGGSDKVKKIAETMPDPMPQLTQVAYEMTSKADEVSGGNVLDENLV